MNWCFHWSTDTEEVHRHRQDLRMRAAAATPTSDLPAPHGSTMMPELRYRSNENECQRSGMKGHVQLCTTARAKLHT